MANKSVNWSASSIWTCALALLGLLAGAGALAFEEELVALEERVEAASAVLRELDEQASACLGRLGESEDAAEQPSECAAFLAAIDGETLGAYLEHCGELRRWRDDYVDNPPPAGSDSERDRQRLIAVERVCGEDALRRRTEFVAAAFNALNERRAGAAAGISLQRRLGELEFQSTLGGWRGELDTANPNRRVRDETLRQFDQLEEELIRQQINRPR